MPTIRKALLLPMLVIALLAGSFALAGPALAHGTTPKTTIDLRRGDTVLTLDRGTLAVLSRSKVTVTAIKPATARGRELTFPVVSGRVDRAGTTGKIRHIGRIEFAEGGDRLGLENLHIDLDRDVVTGQVSGTRTRITVLTLTGAAAATTDRDGRAITVKFATAKLTDRAARALNEKFGVKTFKKDLTVGSVRTTARS